VHPFLAHGQTRAWALVLPALVAVGAGALCLLALIRPREACALLVVAVGVDALVVFGAWFEWRGGSPSPGSFRADRSLSVPPVFGAMNDAAGGIDRYLAVGVRFATPADPDVTDLKRVRSANGFDPLAPRDYIDELSMTYVGHVSPKTIALKPGNHVLDLLRVSVVLLSPAIDPPAALGAGRPVRDGRNVRYDYQPRLPEAFVVGSVQRVARPETLRRLAGSAPFAPDSTALIESDCDACLRANAPGPAGRARVTHWGTSAVDVDVTASRSGMLVVSQAFFKGWRATVDGQAAPVVRVDGLVLGVPVGAGRHQVSLHYRAPGLKPGAAVTMVTLVALVSWCAWEFRRRRAVGAT
jgi:hypothetical protein